MMIYGKSAMAKYKQICIGIDQSYVNTGVSVSAEGLLKKVTSIRLDKYKTNSERRKVLRNQLFYIINRIEPLADEVICVIERIRLRSQGFINIDYIKSIGALNSIIVDVMHEFGIKVYSVDTRCWKSQVIGTSKPCKNKYNVPDEKWPTVLWCVKQGFKSDILIDMSNSRKTKGVFIDKQNNKMMFNNDAADSAAISMFWFVGDKDKLKVEC